MDMYSSSQRTIDIGKYKKVKKIKSGGFGVVYSVQQIETKKLYAAKVIICDDNEGEIQNIIDREVGILVRANHPTIIKFYGYSLQDFQNENNITILMELASNGSLEGILKKFQEFDGPIDFTDTSRQIILVGVARGMKYLHDRNIIHRDLKPGNILLDDLFHPHITDFGLSKIFEFGKSKNQSKFGGTLIYMAPEVIKQISYDGKADVYSFAILMYEIVTDSAPYPELLSGKMSEFDFRNKVVSESYRPKFTFPIKESIQKLIEQCWSEDPEERPNFGEIFKKFALKEGDDYLLENVDKDELMNYIEDITQVTDQIDLLNQKNENFEKENQKLKEENDQLAIENKQLKTDYDQISTENQKLKEDNNQLAIENKQLKTDYDQISTENQKLKEENDQLTIENKQLKTDYDQISTENQKLKEDNDQLLIENKKLKLDYDKISIENQTSDNNAQHTNSSELEMEFMQLLLKNSMIAKEIYRNEKNVRPIDAKLLQNPAVLYINDFDPSIQKMPTIIKDLKLKSTLKHFLHKSSDTIKYINLLGIAIGMNCINSNNIHLCNANPENIFLDEDYYPHICFFDSSRFLKKRNLSFDNLIYVDPEVLEERSADSKADVYSYSMIAYRILTGIKPAVEGNSYMQMKNAFFIIISVFWKTK